MIPVFGDPWTIPFEFPLFQAIASVAMTFGISADPANRIVGLLFFVLTAFLIWLLVRKLANPIVAAITLVVFSFSPFALVCGRVLRMCSIVGFGALVVQRCHGYSNSGP
jgi:hypothetical protein